MMLDAGDVAFWGNGPDDEPWFIGIEYKQVSDLVDCIKSGRFAGTQLPEMVKLYNVCILLVEGPAVPDFGRPIADSFRLWRPFGGGRGVQYGISYQAYDNFQTSVAMTAFLAGKLFIVKHSREKNETKQIIKDLFKLYQKPFHEHTTLSTIDLTKAMRAHNQLSLLRVEPDDLDYPKLVLQKSLFQIKGIGWELAGVLAEKFGTIEVALQISQRAWEELDRIGKGLAKRVFTTLHGYEDPNYKRKKGKSNEAKSDVPTGAESG
jgi:ERCC4-type nuclease